MWCEVWAKGRRDRRAMPTAREQQHRLDTFRHVFNLRVATREPCLACRMMRRALHALLVLARACVQARALAWPLRPWNAPDIAAASAFQSPASTSCNTTSCRTASGEGVCPCIRVCPCWTGTVPQEAAVAVAVAVVASSSANCAASIICKETRRRKADACRSRWREHTSHGMTSPNIS